MTQKIVHEAVGAVLAEHSQRLGVPETETTGVQFWHLLVSLLDYADEQGIDFDLEVEAAKEHLKDMDL